MEIRIVSATRYSEQDFWNYSALGQSITRLNISKDFVQIAFENGTGLPDVYNKAIESSASSDGIVFIHDDVWIEDFLFIERVREGLEQFDAFGVIGNRRRVPGQPSWAYTSLEFTWDQEVNLIGAIAHGDYPFGEIMRFTNTRGVCELVDGLMIAASCLQLRQQNILFDKQFSFHFYDLDFCRQVRKAGLRLGVHPISLTHQSSGKLGTEEWRSSYSRYIGKWDQEFSAFSKLAFSTPAHDNFNPDILKIMNKDYDTIVEVGCSRGALARAYRESFNCNRYIGIDIDESSAVFARNHCTEVIIGDVEIIDDDAWKKLFPSSLWIFGDSLEHLKDPWTLLSRIRQSIEPEDSIIACIPNAQHWSVIARLASGNFQYEDEGLLDRTHLRWFTKRTIIDLFEKTGYSIELILPRIFEDHSQNEYLPMINKIAHAYDCSITDISNNCIPIQYVIKARPA
ncbi:methyltransferase domain-containing protein [Cyanobium sp. AMD-g]|uniref:methyltransferase domain-containing protein n=1 Tax=Cyanobium sp. AMD-g TaxID=2823699 RepID=UPI0020CFDDE0|nr:methyltransferase domain-containing protein [Cyanobium sp. AMD-g]MCP9931446.1 methyltransferase domain-containing protein [Cyanobium sp. AMD-g]